MMPSLSTAIHFASAYLFDFSGHTALSLGALISVALTADKQQNALARSHHFFIIVFVCLLIVALRGTNNTGYLRGSATLLIDIAVPYAVFAASIRNPTSQNRITVSLCIAGGMLAMIGIFEILTSWPTFVAMNEHLGLHPLLLVAKFRGGRLRSAGPMGESTEMGFVLVFCLLATIASRQSFKDARAHALVAGLIGVGLLTPQSKGAWIGAGVGMIALAAHRSSLARPGKFVIAAVLGASFLLLASIYKPGEDPSQGSGAYRTRLLRRGLEEFWKAPMVGDTLQSVINHMQDLKQGEHIVDFVNSYLYFALTLGAFGLLAILLGFLIPIVRAWTMRRNRSGEERPRQFAAFCFSCFVSSMAMFAFTSFIHRAVLLLMMFSVALIRDQSRRHLPSAGINSKTQRPERVNVGSHRAS